MFKAGTYAALITTYTKNGLVNYKETKRLVRHLIRQGIEGLYVYGLTGEAFLLSVEERMKLLDVVIKENRGETMVVCHCGSISTEHTTQLAKHAVQVGVDVVSAVPPFY